MALPSYVGRYAIRHEIARGAFAIVVLAWDEELDSAVALKVLDSGKGESGPEFQARFMEEARLLRRIRSHHVVTVHDVGRLNDGRPYFVMDLADRGTLADWLENWRTAHPDHETPAGTHELVAYADAIAEGLGAIHRAGVIHRDIKPANILFQSVRPAIPANDATVIHPSGGADPNAANGPATPEGDVFDESRILVGDLGIAKDVTGGGAEATLIAGTPAYQAPEQLDPEEPVTAAADVYSATAVLHHLIMGTRPPRAGRLEDALRTIPKHWQSIMQRGMALKPEDRFASIQSWQAAVHDVLAEEAADQTNVENAGKTEVASRIVSADCPYKGLGSYQPDDSDKFYGREALTDELVRRLQTHNVLVVGGPSGSGKSSVVRAGLIPELKAGAVTNSAEWRISLMTPGRDAMAELYFQLVQSLGTANQTIGPNDLLTRPALARRVAAPTGAEPPLVLCIDQFEELFTLSPASQREPFIEALSSMTDPADATVRVVIAIRADYYPTCAQIPWLAERISENQVLVGPMGPSELRRAITEPARQSGLYLERNLIDTIVDTANNEAGSLPLVAHALVETWMRRKGATLTLEGYRAAGGVAGAIAQTAGDIYEHRFSREEKDATRRLFLRLVTPGEGAGDTRRIVEQAEIDADSTPEVTRRIVDQLTDARLLTVNDNDVQIAHEALLRSWPTLRGWIDDARDDLRMRQRLIRHAEEWRGADREADLLLRGTPLLSAVDWHGKHPDHGGALVSEYIDASVAEHERIETLAKERQTRARRVRTAAAAALSILALGATTASVLAFFAYRDAQRNQILATEATRESDARFALALGAVGDGLAQDDPRLALFLGAEALARAGDVPPGYSARSAIIAARQELATDEPHLLGGPLYVGDALSQAVSPDGAYLAIGGRDGQVSIIDVLTRQQVGSTIDAHPGGVEDLKFSPDGSILASAGTDGTVQLWSIDDGFIGDGRQIAEFDDIVWGLAFDATGKWLATASEVQSVQIWDVTTGAPKGDALAEGIGDLLSVAFSPDGSGLLASTGSGEVFSWSLPDGAPLMRLIDDVHTSDVWGLYFKPSGDQFATVSSDGTSALFSYPGGEFLGRAFDELDTVHSVAFARDGDVLVGGGESGRLHVWNIAQEAPLFSSATGHTGRISAVDVSDRARLAASMGRDHVVRIWSLFDPIPTALQYTLDGAAKGIATNADGTVVAAAADSGLITVWQGAGADGRDLAGHAHQVWALALSPDSAKLASGDRSGSVRLWDVESGEATVVRSDSDGAVWWVGFFQSGERLAVAKDGGIDVIDVATGNQVGGLQQDSGQITRAALSPDGASLAASTSDGRVRLVDLSTLTVVREMEAAGDVIWSVAFSPDGNTLAIATSDEDVVIWDLEQDIRIDRLAGHRGGATDVAFLSDGATFAAVDRSGALHLWDLLSRRRLSAPLQGHARASWRLAVATDAGLFVTSGDDGHVRVWDILNLARACEIGAVAFDSDRRREYFGDEQEALACDGH